MFYFCLQRTFASDLKYLVLSSFCHSQHASNCPPLVHHILSDFTTPCKKELSGHGQLRPCAHQIYVNISQGATVAPCLRVLDGNYHTVTHRDENAGCKGRSIIFSTGIPEYVIQCKVPTQWITIHTFHHFAVNPVVSLGSAHYAVDDLDSHAALTMHRWVTLMLDPAF